MVRRFFVLAVFLVTASWVSHAIAEPGIPPGWGNDFAAAKAQADATGRPLVLYWGNHGCGNCDALTWDLLSAEGQAWTRERQDKYIFCYVRGSNSQDDPRNPGAAEFARTAAGKQTGSKALSKLPFVCMYQVKASGNIRAKSFTGLKNYTPVKEGTLLERVTASVDEYFAAYLADDELAFTVAGTEDDRFEAEPSTEWVDVPVVRLNQGGQASECRLVAHYSGGPYVTNVFSWAAGATEKLVRIPLRDVRGFTFRSGQKIALELYNAAGEKQAKTYIYMVDKQPNGPVNPYFADEDVDLKFGEWTMNLDAATNLAAKTEGACTLVFFTGALWCPHCRPLEATVFESEEFRTWTKENNIALALMDNPMRSKSDSYAQAAVNGYADLSSVPNGPNPTLLRHGAGQDLTHGDGVSGSSYISRKMISSKQAERVLQRNHDLGYADGFFCAPSGFRTGYPTLILLDRDGQIRGRWVRYESPSNTYDLAECMFRLKDFVKLAQTGAPAHSYAATTQLKHIVGGPGVAPLRVQQNARFFELSSCVPGRLTVQANGATKAPVTFRLHALKYVSLRMRDADGEVVRTLDYPITTVLASGTGTLDYEVGAADTNLYLEVSAYGDAKTNFYGAADTSFVADFKTSQIVRPQDTPGRIVSSGYPIGVAVEAGRHYRIAGCTDVTGSCTSHGDGLYTATDDCVLAVSSEAGSVITIQKWKPGVIGFEASAVSFGSSDKFGTVVIRRTGGASGEAKVLVTDKGTATATDRYVWTDRHLVFADGMTETNVTFAIKGGTVSKEEVSFVLSLESEDEGPLPAEVSAETCTVSVRGSDKPSFAERDYALLFWKGFANEIPLPLVNVGEDDGVRFFALPEENLPEGLTIECEEGKAKLACRPSELGDTYFYCLVGEEREGRLVMGEMAEFEVFVEDPSDYNAHVGKMASRTVPLFWHDEETDTDLLAGQLTVSVTSKNKISAKYVGTEDATISYSGYWQTLDVDNGNVIGAEIVKGSSTLLLSLDSEGKLTARMTMNKNGYSCFASKGDVLEGSVDAPTPGAFANYKGLYNVQLPDADTVGAGQDLTGTGFVILKMTSSADVEDGLVTYAGRTPRGGSFSGTASLATLSSKHVLLPVFVRTDTEVIGFQADIKRGVKTAWKHPDEIEYHQLVLTAAGTSAYHLLREGDWRETLTTLDVYGGAYTKNATPTSICTTFGYERACRLGFDASRLAPGVHGAVVKVASATATANASGFTLSGKRDGSVTMDSFALSTGKFSGTAEVTFADGTTVSGSYYGILMPGWTACGDCELDIVTRPFGSGLLKFMDSVNVPDGYCGLSKKSIYRTIPVNLDAKLIEK